MPSDALATLLALLSIFRPTLTQPGYAKFLVLAAGWILTQAPAHAVTEALVVTGVSGVRHWEAYHRFFSRGTWDPDQLGFWMFVRIVERQVGPVLRLVIDDTLCPKKGPEVVGIASHLDAVRSTKRHKSFCFGHCWVVLAVMVPMPFSDRMWALPVLFRLYRSKKDALLDYVTKTALAREMLLVVLGWQDRIARWTHGQPGILPSKIEVALDQGYAVGTVLEGLLGRVTFLGAMRSDAALYAVLPSDHGTRRKKGDRLPTPMQFAEDEQTPWSCVYATIYGETKAVLFKTMTAQWYGVCGEAVLRIVVVRCPNGALPVRVFFSTDPTMSIRGLLEGYWYRWSIEVFFREAKQLLGLADSQAWKEASVRRMVPFVGLLYSVLVVWFAQGRDQGVVTLPNRPWYKHKQGLCFADILRAARGVLTEVDVLAIAEEQATCALAEEAEPHAAQLLLPFAA